MGAASRRRVAGYIWNEQMARIERAHEEIRGLTTQIMEGLESHPVSVRLLLHYAAQIALHLVSATTALRELERIAQEHRECD